MTTQRRIAYVGNFGPEHSTENHVARALRSLGHHVSPLQENDRATWDYLAGALVDPPDLLLWTRTWHLPEMPQLKALDNMRVHGVPTVGFHLDRWWGLPREHQVADEPFFRCDLVATADGGHDERWHDAGVAHWWAPPAVSEDEARRTGNLRPVFQSAPVVFVGSHERYHPEWPWRRELVTRLQRHYGRRFKVWPGARQTIRGQNLADLYASATVVVGDSCLVGSPARYWSDRIPETVGRGGFLIHPEVAGMEDHYRDGEHLVTVEPEHWDAMRAAIDMWLDPDRAEDRTRIRAAGRAHVLEHHTYEVRMAELLAECETRGLLKVVRDGAGLVRVRTRDVGPARFDLRAGTSDGVVVHETWNENVYALEAADVEDRVVVDLGANVGSFTVWAALAGARRVLAVEPASPNLAALGRNLEVNDLGPETVLVEHCAVGATEGRGFVWYRVGIEGSSQVMPDEPRRDDEEVEVVPLATIVDRAGGHVHVLKVDVEGDEYETIAGAASDGTLAKVDRIVGEWHPLADHITAGRFLCGLLRYGTLRIFGEPETGGQFEWTRYGA